jgi:hypothetical protein
VSCVRIAGEQVQWTCEGSERDYFSEGARDPRRLNERDSHAAA